MLRALAPLVLAAAAIALAPDAARAQACPGPNDNFWKNDGLPQIPGGAFAVAVVPGLCQGEAIGAVFTLPSAQSPQLLNKVAVGFGNQFGTSGFQALANVEIYDGVTWSGNKPTLGAKLFDLEAQTQSSMQVFTHGIVEFDMTPYNVTVGNGKNTFVVAFRSSFNPNGNCTSGFPSNFVTDAAQSFNCTSTPKKNLMDIQGQGWVDPSNATVQGFPLCPLFYNGDWIIRACSTPVSPPTCQQNLGLGGPGDTVLSMCGGDLSAGTTATFKLEQANPNVVGVLFAGVTFAPTFVPELFGVLCPLPPILSLALPTDANGQISIPGVPGGGGPVAFYVQMVTPDPGQLKGYEVSNCLKIQLLP